MPAAELAVDLVDPAEHGGLVAPSRLAQRRQVVAYEVDRVRDEARVDLTDEGHVAPRPEPPDPRRVPGEKRLGERDEASAAASGFVDVRDGALHRGALVEENWRALDDGDAGHPLD